MTGDALQRGSTVALTALLFAHHGAASDGEPPAVERVAGASVIERQIAQVRALGAARILVAVERMPPGLAAALVRADVEIVRAGRGFAVAAEDRVLVIEDALVVDRRIVAAVLSAEAPALAVWKGRAARGGAQRIDPATHWAGAALYSGAFVGQVLAGLGEWDLQATLLRAAFADARPARIDAAALATYDPERRRDVPPFWQPVHGPDDARRAATAWFDAARRAGGGPGRRVAGPIADRLLSKLLDHGIGPRDLVAAALSAGVAATVAFAGGRLWPGLLLGLLAGLLQGIGETLSGLRDDTASRPGREWLVLKLVETSWYAALGGFLASIHGVVGPWAVAALIILASSGSTVVCEVFRRVAGRHLDDAGRFERRFAPFAAGRQTLPWSLLPFAALDLWYAGFVWLAIYAVSTFVAVQARFFVRLLGYARAHSPLMAANIASARTPFLSGGDRSAS